MTPEQLRTTLRSIGWKQADLARKAGVHRTTVATWCAEGPPPWVAEYVGALAAIAELHQRFVAAPPRERLAEPDDVPEADTRAARMAQHLAQLDPAALDPAGGTGSNREPL
ncbi:MAG: XRE family transcriptional regulator [Rhodospirillales bacterium]|nr:XRE family transcriptional regulator [Rhodospirillales bacterium]